LPLNGLDFFAEQILLKLILNILSTLVMGRLGFYQGNLMTSLYPSNHKLIDRAIRYTRHRHELLSGNLLPYEKVADAVFAEMRQLKPGESIVEKAVKHLIHS
jgi:N-acetylmuramic acid 6-phosphate etherase